MAYKTVLVHVDASRNLGTNTDIACKIAGMDDAHLTGTAATGVSRFLYQVIDANPRDPVVAPHVEAMRQRAGESLQKFEVLARKSGVNSIETRLVDDDAAGALTTQAPYCDLIVIGQYNADEYPASALDQDLAAYVVMNTHCPILLVPYAGTFDTAGDRVLVAWNGSPEATRAVRDALPMLKRARLVTVVMFNPAPGTGTPEQDPLASIALYLSRHGVKVEAAAQTTDIDVGNALLSLSADMNADLLVMGCYGRSRFREMMLGGASRTILREATIPVFMSH